MSVEEQIRSEMRTVGLTVEPDTDLALAQVESGVYRQHTRRAIILATAAAAAAVAGVVWAAGSLGWLTGQGDVQPAEQPGEQQVDWHGGWVRVEDPDLQRAYGLHTVLDVDGRLVAFGLGQAPIFTSTDGTNWAPVDTAKANLEGAIHGGPGLIAYGRSEFTEDGHAVVWTSPDGQTWTPVEDPDSDFDVPYSEITGIAVGGPGFVAIGTSDNRPAVWTSRDGRDWTPPRQLTSNEGRLGDVMQTESGLLAKGMVDLDPNASTDPEFEPAIWTSSDGGTTWTRAARDTVGIDADAHSWVEAVFDDDTSVQDVFAAGPGLVAVGSAEHPDRGLVWTSVDGQTWTSVPEEQHGLDSGVSRVISAGGEFVAVGGSVRGAAVWTSVDGITWESVIDESFSGRPLHMSDVVETDTGLVVVGDMDWDQSDIADDPDWSAAVWVMERP